MYITWQLSSTVWINEQKPHNVNQCMSPYYINQCHLIRLINVVTKATQFQSAIHTTLFNSLFLHRKIISIELGVRKR